MDTEDRIVVAIVDGPLDEPSGAKGHSRVPWSDAIKLATQALAKAEETGIVKQVENARGELAVLNVGITHGNGTTVSLLHLHLFLDGLNLLIL